MQHISGVIRFAWKKRRMCSKKWLKVCLFSVAEPIPAFTMQLLHSATLVICCLVMMRSETFTWSDVSVFEFISAAV